MQFDTVFLSVNARDFAAQSEWWSTVLGRRWDRQPMPSCHEWDLMLGVLFQVLDNDGEGGPTAVSLHLASLDDAVARLRAAGIAVPDPGPVEGFASLRLAQFDDPEGNPVTLLDGA